MQSALVPNYPLVPIPSTLASVVSSSSCSCFNKKKTKHFSRRPHVQLYCSSSGNKVDFDSEALLPQNDDDLDIEIKIEIEKTGNNCRRIQSEIGIEAPLSTVWNLLTDYERLADFIPGLAVCRLLHKTHNSARLFQIGEHNLAFGLKFNAKGIVDCYETPLERLANDSGQKRDIEFNMVEGDFEIFQGKWSLVQLQQQEETHTQTHPTTTTLSYLVHVKPRLWLPVRLVEGRLCKEIKINLACIRQEALKSK